MLPSFKCFAVFMFSAQNIPSSQSVHSFRDAAPSKEVVPAGQDLQPDWSIQSWYLPG